MVEPLLSTLSKVAFPAIGIAAMLFAARRENKSFSTDLRFERPRPSGRPFICNAHLMLLIFVDGRVPGAACHLCRSMWVPIVMHIAGNLFSINQSLAH